MKRALRLPAVMCCIGLAAAAPLRAQQRILIYRCTDASGHVTLQNDQACPAGTRQQTQVVEAPPALPVFVPPEAPAAAAPPVVPAAVAPVAAETAAPPVPTAERGPPPALLQCRTWDQVAYLTDDPQPTERCRPLQVVGIARGVSRSDASACEKVVDQCEAVPAESLCRAWKRRLDEAEFRWKFAGARSDDVRKLEYERLAAILAGSDCALRSAVQKP